MIEENGSKNRIGVIISILSLIAALLVIPEVRTFIGLEGDNQKRIALQSSEMPVDPPEQNISSVTVTPAISPEPVRSTAQPDIQVGPYINWRDRAGAETLLFSVAFFEERCRPSFPVVVDDQEYVAAMITNPQDPLYKRMAHNRNRGEICDYELETAARVIPVRYFSVSIATRGVNMPASGTPEWCFRPDSKKWTFCP